MGVSSSSDKKLAVLIDADNAPARVIGPLLAEVARYGIASVKRIYGDWSSSKLQKWKAVLLPHAIVPVQQFGYTSGKNATDMALVIDAMDLLYSGTFDGFCIVSSDSDFTRLASRIRESGLDVYGFGEKKTPEAFRRACDEFVFVENLVSVQAEGDDSLEEGEGSAADGAEDPQSAKQRVSAMRKLVYHAIREIADEDGWAELGHVGNHLKRTHPDFDFRSYGFQRLSDLLESIPALVLKKGENPTEIYVRREGYLFLIKLVKDAIGECGGYREGKVLDVVCELIRRRDPAFNVASLGKGHRTLEEAVRSIDRKHISIEILDGAEYVSLAAPVMQEQ